jgi:hypothetical protein
MKTSPNPSRRECAAETAIAPFNTRKCENVKFRRSCPTPEWHTQCQSLWIDGPLIAQHDTFYLVEIPPQIAELWTIARPLYGVADIPAELYRKCNHALHADIPTLPWSEFPCKCGLSFTDDTWLWIAHIIQCLGHEPAKNYNAKHPVTPVKRNFNMRITMPVRGYNNGLANSTF